MNPIRALEIIKEAWDEYGKTFPLPSQANPFAFRPLHPSLQKIDIILRSVDIAALQIVRDKELDDILMMSALEAAGVDNWEGYEDALEMKNRT